jgi:hypothetical protein
MLPNLKILNSYQVKFGDDDDDITIFDVQLEINNSSIVYGLDPGSVHIGVAYINGAAARLLEITTKRKDATEKRIAYMWQILSRLSDFDPIMLVIEGASYGDKYRQVELQDIRCGATTWAMNRSSDIKIQIVPPTSIRKTVFGSGKIKNPWKEIGIPDNAAAALACGLYAVLRHDGK